MANEQWTNEATFVLFINDKGTNPKRPDYRGMIYLAGEEYKLSGWLTVRKDGTGQQYIRGKVEKAQPADTQPAANAGFPTSAPSNIPPPNYSTEPRFAPDTNESDVSF